MDLCLEHVGNYVEVFFVCIHNKREEELQELEVSKKRRTTIPYVGLKISTP